MRLAQPSELSLLSREIVMYIVTVAGSFMNISTKVNWSRNITVLHTIGATILMA